MNQDKIIQFLDENHIRHMVSDFPSGAVMIDIRMSDNRLYVIQLEPPSFKIGFSKVDESMMDFSTIPDELFADFDSFKDHFYKKIVRKKTNYWTASLKALLTLFLSLGCTLSFLVGREYSCTVKGERLPTYYGSPFLFMEKSLASSMEYYYSVSGLVANMLVWSVVLLLIRRAINRVMQLNKDRKSINISYYTVVAMLACWTCLHIFVASVLLAPHQFGPNMTYWYWNVTKKEQGYNAKCNSKWRVLPKW